jgi:homotetrameric cytidine deaminase
VRKNVELKARIANPDDTAARCIALGAEDGGVLVQRDTYYAARRGRLKLREDGERGNELIAYFRLDGPEPDMSAYMLVPTDEPTALSAALDASLGTAVVVSKHRRLFFWENVRIHIDEVEGLGSFVELEALVEPDGAEAAQERVARLRTELAIDDASLVAGGYSDLLLSEPEALLRAADAAMRNAYAIYSEFKVGAAVRGASGAIYSGANVENVAYPQGACAEASALGALVTAGETRITAVAVVAEKVERCPPCGGCRQRLAEFGAPETPI